MLMLILSSAPLAMGIALSPLAIISVIVLLAQGNRRGALWFLFGWIAGLTLLTTIVATVGQNMNPNQHETVRPWIAPAQIVVGAGVVTWVIVTFVRNRHAPPPQELPKVLQAVDKMGPVKSFSMATFMAGVNAKNVALLLVFLLSLLASPRPVVWTIATVGTFILLASITILIPVVVTLTLGNRADRILEKWRGWMVANQNFIMNGFIGVIGLVLLAQGLGL